MTFANQTAACLPVRRDFGMIKSAAYFCFRCAVLSSASVFSTAAVADVPALCAPAKARHDRVMASGERGAVLAARERIKALAGACPQLWAAVRSAPLPPVKELAKSPQVAPKAEAKQSGQSAQVKPLAPNPLLDKEARRFLKMGFKLFEEPTISQPPTTYVGDGDYLKPGERWYLWRTQEGCYFFMRLPSSDHDAKGLAFHKKKWTLDVSQYRWQGQCTPGKLINGTGSLQEHKRFIEGTEVANVIKTSTKGAMVNGLWNGVTHYTQLNSPEWPGLFHEYRMGCNITVAFDANCQSPRIPRELTVAGG